MDEKAMARANHAAGESGWDFTPRMGWEVYNYAALDLNSWLYAQEDQLSYFAGELGLAEEQQHWQAVRDHRAALCRQYLKGEDGVFYDYHEIKKERSCLVSAATYYPLYVGMATQEEADAAVKVLHRVEEEFGVACVEKCDVPGNYQWGHPNGWPPTQRIIVDGLLRYGYREDAFRIARKYCDLVESCYEQTGHLWEKYNVVKGNAEVVDEYTMPTMLGWTFGVYVYFCKLLGREMQ
jgi:alpha,alpha-trehalase